MRLTFLLFIAVGGCATTPRPSYTTVKQPKVIAECLQRALGPVAQVREGNRAVITSRDAPQLSLRIYDTGTVQVWRPLPFEGQTRSAVESCI